MTQTNSSEKKYAVPTQMLEEAHTLKLAGQYADAFTIYQSCLEQYPDNAEAFCSAVSLIEEQTSLNISLKEFGINYNTEELQNALLATMQTLQVSGKFNDALAYAGALCTLDPSNWMFPALTGKLYLNKREFEGAIRAFNAALHLAPDNIQCRDNLLKTFYYLGSGKFDVKTKRWISLFLKELDTVDIGVLARVWVMLLLTDPDFKEIMQGQQYTKYKNFKKWLETLSEKSLSQLSSDYLLDGLRICVVPNINIERLLYHLRRTILNYSVNNLKEAPTWATGFAYALAEQCFLNEYIYEETKEEKEQVETLINALNNKQNITPLSVSALACYRPLNSFPALTKTFLKLLENLSEDDRILYQRVISQQIEEPEIEQQLKKEIKSFSTIDNEVSQKVRDQYESNPYPRWISTGSVENDEGGFVFAETDPLKHYDILIAGCATGHYPIKVCKNYPSSSVTGVDISLSSLAYGLRKAQEMKMENLKLMHGDILGLENLKQQFDIIFSSGVLHHMKNPEAGWQVLTNILKPGGLMKIGLYSELERQHITDCRQYIVEHKIPDTPKGIRRIRKIIAGFPEGHPFKKVMPFNDFYSISMMRDLFFHVQEQCFTIPRIQQALDDFDLEFLSFSMVMPQAVQQYSQMFPDDPAMTNLEHWDQYEHKYPDTFTGLYQFWCRKKQ
ncbi:MAG: methyltransferase domain-containing protein [Methylococcales bacterium]